MCSRRRFTVAAALLALGSFVIAGETEPILVLVNYRVAEQDPDRIVETVTNRLEGPLQRLPGVMRMHSMTGNGTVLVEIQFDGDATQQDVAAVTRRLDEVELDAVTVLSRSVRLGTPSRYWALSQSEEAGS
ncbi:MAG TPA: hypothetical protein VNT33_13350 [Telluria sp.]|nr:hypothetical protein [Telluria sp.]